MEHIKISIAVPSDARGVKEVQYKTWLATYPNEQVGITIDDIEDRFKDAFTEENIKKRELYYQNFPVNECVWVAKDDERVIGFCMVKKGDAKNELSAMYILPEYQGKGVGGKLWKQALTFFDPLKETSVEVAAYNDKAISFYKKLGFEDFGKRWEEEKFRMKSGAVIPDMEMVRKVKD